MSTATAPRDWYRDLTSSGVGAAVAARSGLPRPALLRRHVPGGPLLDGPALLLGVGGVGGSPHGDRVAALLDAAGCARVTAADAADGARLGAIVVDASGATAVGDLTALQTEVGPAVRRLGPSGRVVVLGAPVEAAPDVTGAAVRAALGGFIRSLGKELRAGATANLLLVDDDAGAALDSPLRFLLSGRAAFVSGQVLRVGAAVGEPPAAAARPHDGRVAVVTGAARGIGAAIAQVLARDGATVVCVDLPAAGQALARVANDVGGIAVQLDITAPDAPQRLVDHLAERHGGVDAVIHNAGITRDKLLVNGDAERWDAVLGVNLAAPLALTDALLAAPDLLRRDGRIVVLSSLAGLAGNRGQTSYAASKAGLVGMVRALAPLVAARGATANAVAPGFIETEMTAAMPLATREVGRRLNSLRQGGLPIDVAETVAWLAEPGSGGVNGEVVRVCGQNLLGA